MGPEIKSGKKRCDTMAMYAKIALDIANRIASGEMEEGQRLSGRSLVASEYGVSPETIRRAFSLLEEMKVVEVFQNSGVLVKSKENALSYISKHTDSDQIRSMLSRMHELIENHARIEKELYDIHRTLIDSSERFAATICFNAFKAPSCKRGSQKRSPQVEPLIFNSGKTTSATSLLIASLIKATAC
jgi:DNA-binding GntR family transcriptional regulator